MATSAFNQVFALGTDHVFLTRSTTAASVTINNVGKWNGQAGTMSAVSSGVGSFGVAIEVGESDDHVYVGGSFTQAGGSVTVNKIAYYNGSTWNSLGGASVFNSDVSALLYDRNNNILYAGSHGTTTNANRISMWDGSSWTPISSAITVSNYPRFVLDSENNMYAGIGNAIYRYNRGSSTWTTINASVGGTIQDLKYSSNTNRIYMALQSSNAVKYYNLNAESLTSLSSTPSGTVYAVAVGADDAVYVATWPSSGFVQSVCRYDSGSWTAIYNHSNTSGVLGLSIDSNNNIFAFGNSGGYIVGKSPYTNGNWAQIASNTVIDYSGPSFEPEAPTTWVNSGLFISNNYNKLLSLQRLKKHRIDANRTSRFTL